MHLLDRRNTLFLWLQQLKCSNPVACVESVAYRTWAGVDSVFAGWVILFTVRPRGIAFRDK